jgi:hypothetical protein
MKEYFNPKENKMTDLFETLSPVFSVSCHIPNVVIGYKGAAVYINVEAKDEEDAMNKALANPEFTKHIRMKEFERKHLDTYKPTGLYVIGRVEYFEGDERL